MCFSQEIQFIDDHLYLLIREKWIMPMLANSTTKLRRKFRLHQQKPDGGPVSQITDENLAMDIFEENNKKKNSLADTPQKSFPTSQKKVWLTQVHNKQRLRRLPKVSEFIDQ